MRKFIKNRIKQIQEKIIAGILDIKSRKQRGKELYRNTSKKEQINHILSDMVKCKPKENKMKRNYDEEQQRTLDRFQELYEQDPDLRVVVANREGDLELLYDTFFIKKELDILDISPKEKWSWLHRCNLNSYSPAPLPVMEFYIKHNVPVNAQDMYGMTPLHYALRAKNAEGAMALLKAEADPNIPDEDDATALAYIHGMPKELDLLKLMLEKGGNVHFHNGQHGILEGIKKYRSDNPDFIPVIELMEKYA